MFRKSLLHLWEVALIEIPPVPGGDPKLGRLTSIIDLLRRQIDLVNLLAFRISEAPKLSGAAQISEAVKDEWMNEWIRGAFVVQRCLKYRLDRPWLR